VLPDTTAHCALFTYSPLYLASALPDVPVIVSADSIVTSLSYEIVIVFVAVNPSATA